mmetsp:Transcript_72427/g.193080  ORF Transcript_72427/g.193080 Transcript_72427/m.193080 type:complete len:201 (-) Transcript_72427:111-713(-)
MRVTTTPTCCVLPCRIIRALPRRAERRHPDKTRSKCCCRDSRVRSQWSDRTRVIECVSRLEFSSACWPVWTLCPSEYLKDLHDFSTRSPRWRRFSAAACAVANWQACVTLRLTSRLPPRKLAQAPKTSLVWWSSGRAARRTRCTRVRLAWTVACWRAVTTAARHTATVAATSSRATWWSAPCCTLQAHADTLLRAEQMAP